MINTLLKRRMENTKKNKKGFTLVELIVVLVIIAILAAVLIPTVSGYIGKAKKTAVQSQLRNVVTAAQSAATSVLATKSTGSLNLSTDQNTILNEMKEVGGSNLLSDTHVTQITFDLATGTVVYAQCNDGTYYASVKGSSYKTGKGESKVDSYTAAAGEGSIMPASGKTGIEFVTE